MNTDELIAKAEAANNNRRAPGEALYLFPQLLNEVKRLNIQVKHLKHLNALLKLRSECE